MKRTKDIMSLRVSVILLIVGLLLGTVFSFGVPYWNDRVELNEALSVNATFSSYQEITRRTSRQGYIILYFDDYEALDIDGACLSKELRDAIKELPHGANLDLLVHPHSNTVLGLSIGDDIILDFDEAQDALYGESIGFLALGIFLYFVALYALCHLIRRGIKAKRELARK